MLHALKIATRYLTASKVQTALLVFVVATGVFIFMSALIGGLAAFIMAPTAGGMAHITIQAGVVEPDLIMPTTGRTPLLVQQKDSNGAVVLKDTAALLALIEALSGVIAVSPQINGPGFLTLGRQTTKVSINGMKPGKDFAIADLAGYVTEGSANLAAGGVLRGKTLAEEMGLRLSLGRSRDQDRSARRVRYRRCH